MLLVVEWNSQFFGGSTFLLFRETLVRHSFLSRGSPDSGAVMIVFF